MSVYKERGGILDPKKVAFITCINDEILWERCRSYIDALEIPEGFSIEVKEIRGAKGMSSAYQKAMEESSAKYKVYLHQDTFVYNQRLIYDFIQLFSAYPQIGLIGVVGGDRLPKSGIWFEDGLHSFGKVWEYRGPGLKVPFLKTWNRRKERVVRFRPVRRPYKPVLVVDGLMMITQYDLRWRVDLYDGFLYYEGPQALEFIKEGYLVAVPYQKNPWCMHWGPRVDRGPEDHQRMWEGIRANARIFLEEYENFIGAGVEKILARQRPER